MSVVGLPIGYYLSVEDEHNYRIYQLISMIVEELKIKWQLDANMVYKILQSSGSIKYLADGYDCLHTLSLERIIDDIEDIVHESKKESD